MIAPADMAQCRESIRTGSLSFHAASKLLPGKVRDPALALYAFCRLADDEVDEGHATTRAVWAREERLDRVYAGRPKDAPEDRAMAAIVAEFDMPRALPAALLEGLAWDAREDRYETLSDVRCYSARVAAAVGVMMCVLMRVRDPNALARACDLGVAMQLTNIARDVGEDARAGRLYLPLEWFEDAGLDPEAFLADPSPRPEIRMMTRRLLAEADRLYRRSEAGIARLPGSARTGIWAARLIYDAIGAEVRRNGHDSVTCRVHTTKGQKLRLIARASMLSSATRVLPTPAVILAPPLEEVRFLVEATAHPVSAPGWSESLISVLAELKRRDADRGQRRAAG